VSGTTIASATDAFANTTRRPPSSKSQVRNNPHIPDDVSMAKRPSMPKADPKTAATFQTLLPADPRIVIRPMFGHTAAFVNGHMFAGTFGAQVFVRLDEPSRAELLAMAGAKRFEPMKGRPMREYVQLPEALLGEPQQARTWVERALASTSTLPPKARTDKASVQRRKPAARTQPRRKH